MSPEIRHHAGRFPALVVFPQSSNVQYTEFPGVDHNAWDPAYYRADLIGRMLKQNRK